MHAVLDLPNDPLAAKLPIATDWSEAMYSLSNIE